MPDKLNGVHEGDRYVRPENPQVVWVVLRPVEIDGLPAHYQLAPEHKNTPVLTFAAAALADRQFFHRLG